MYYRIGVGLALSSIVLSASPAAADIPAVGSVDLANQSWIAGWARDDDCPGCALAVHFYVDGVFNGWTVANTLRSDVGSHAFNYAVPPLPSGRHSAIAYAIGVGPGGVLTGANPPLGVARTLIITERRADFNGDGISDAAVYRRGSIGTWWVNGIYSNLAWGVAEDVPVPADYDGDGKADIAVYRPSNGTWYVLRTSDWTADVRGPFGGGSPRVAGGGHVPVPGDYNGDGRAEPAVFRTTDSTWHVWGLYSGVQWGVWGDIPVPGDYDGDGKTDMAVFRPSTGTWYAIMSSTGVGAAFATWGVNGDIPVPADYDGDGKTDVAVFRPTTGQWWVIASATNSAGVRGVLGGVGDVPTPIDVNGDKAAEIVVFRPSNGTWYSIAYGAYQYGLPGDIPAAHQLQYFQVAAPSCGDGLPAGASCPGGTCNAAGQCSAAYLRAGDSLFAGQCRGSPNGRFQLCYRTDGVLAFTDNGTALWSQTESAGSPGAATLQSNGSLVITNAGGAVVWESGDVSEDLEGVPALQVLDDGDAAIDEEDNLDGLLEPPGGGGGGTCNIEFHSRIAGSGKAVIGIHDVLVLKRPGQEDEYLNMQGGFKFPGCGDCNQVTCNKTAQFDGCDNTEPLLHSTALTWTMRGLTDDECAACSAAYLKKVGYAYKLKDSNGAAQQCANAASAKARTERNVRIKGPPLGTLLHGAPAFRLGRGFHDLPCQRNKTPEERCVQALEQYHCSDLPNSSCPMVCGTPETHLCERCPSAPGCNTCDRNPKACGCPQEEGHYGSCGSTDACGHVFGADTDCNCPNELGHPGSCGLPDLCGHVTGAITDCNCPGEPNHPGSCGNADACGHPGGSPSDPGCQACQPTTSCAAQGLNCGSLWTGCEYEPCGTCDANFECSAQQHCTCVETTTKTCGWVTLCGQSRFLGDCDPFDCFDDFTGLPTCGQHRNDVCVSDSVCQCVGRCLYPGDCGQDNGCGQTCADPDRCTCVGSCVYPGDCGRDNGCGQTCSNPDYCGGGGSCGDNNFDCYDDCSGDWVCTGPCGDSDFDCYDDCSGDWVCGGGGPCGDNDYDCLDDCTGEWVCSGSGV
ncbi:MAG TPA: FG-GAP-like repeat-containing protein [Kofleriaceae bacterium]|jgi:hypothetical protein